MLKTKKIGLILSLFLLLALVLPSMLTPSTTHAQDIEVYALVQVPGLEQVTNLKSSVVSVFDFQDSYAIVGCTDAQLTTLPGNGYTIIEQCDDSESECLSQLSA